MGVPLNTIIIVIMHCDIACSILMLCMRPVLVCLTTNTVPLSSVEYRQECQKCVGHVIEFLCLLATTPLAGSMLCRVCIGIVFMYRYIWSVRDMLVVV